VLIADDLTPAEAAALDPERVADVLLASGSPPHTPRSWPGTRAIPAVVGLGPTVLAIPDGTPIALDGATGEVAIDPPQPALDAFRDRAAELARRRQQATSRATAPAVTHDGVEITVGANIGSVEDAHAAANCGADLAGLVRTDFLFLGRASPPDAAEQETAYRQIAEALDGRPITLRTLAAATHRERRRRTRPASRPISRAATLQAAMPGHPNPPRCWCQGAGG
jgi:multiphosphoryl transfer protein